MVATRAPTTHGIGLSTVSASIYTLFGSVAMQPAVSYLFVMLIDGGVSPQKRRLAKSHLLCGYPYSIGLHVIHVLLFVRSITYLFCMVIITMYSHAG